jgi:pimeloyl-ACP methyl ester carboxylesterase
MKGVRLAIANHYTVLLLHGLGATGAVWCGVEAALRARGFATRAPDLPGHGTAVRATSYEFDILASAVAAGISADARVIIAGHSLGGYVALALASGDYGFTPAAVLSLGAKLEFTEAERARSAEIAAKPSRWFTTREEALARYRLVSGLTEAIAPDESFLARGIANSSQGWQLATDPRAFAIVVPSFTELLSAVRCPVRVARGEHDALVSHEQCAARGIGVLDLPGLGHNAQVENASVVAALVASLAV